MMSEKDIYSHIYPEKFYHDGKCSVLYELWYAINTLYDENHENEWLGSMVVTFLSIILHIFNTCLPAICQNYWIHKYATDG